MLLRALDVRLPARGIAEPCAAVRALTLMGDRPLATHHALAFRWCERLGLGVSSGSVTTCTLRRLDSATRSVLATHSKSVASCASSIGRAAPRRSLALIRC